MAGVVNAFLPHMDGISSTMVRITSRFADWATKLKGSPEFEQFLQYVNDTAPTVGEFIGRVLDALLSTAKALSPVSTALMETIGPLFEAISWLATNAPELIQTLWAMWAAQKAITIGMAAFAVAMGIYQSVMILSAIATAGFGTVLSATGILPIIRAVIVVVGLLVAAFVLAYNHSETFRAIVDGSWNSIKDIVSFVWNDVLKPAFDGIWWAMKKVGDVAVWLWENAIKPAFDFIKQAAQILITVLVTAVLLPIYLAFQALGAVAMWLWEEAISPAFNWIADKASWLWENVFSPIFTWIGDKATWLYDKALKPAFDNAVKAFDALSEAGEWLWNEVLSPIFTWIGDKAGWLYDEAIKPAFDNIKKAVDLVSDSFETGKKNIEKAWNAVRDVAKEPVKFIIDKVYNNGIVPLWNKVAGITGADTLDPIDPKKLDQFHTGGIMSGYSPGRDDRVIAVGGGEAIMRPEWTRAVGADTINSWNAAARSGGISGVRKAIQAGMPAYADGGVVGWLKQKAGDVGDFMSGTLDWLDPTELFSKATTFIKNQMKPITTNPFAREIASMPIDMLKALKDRAIDFFGFGGGGGAGSWLKPVNAAYGTPFGKKGSMWASGRHTGLDFPATVGTIIKAVDKGRVSMARSGGPYGSHVQISHGGGLSSLYAHMSSIGTAAGKNVGRGQTIGRVGATGNVTGPHLHLEARKSGKAVDPMPYLTGGGFSDTAVGAAQAYAKNILSQYGWGPEQFGPLKKLWEGESNWRWNAKNPSSGAYGIPQALPASKMASAGSDWRTNPMTQIKWGLQYIKNRPDYGSPAAAYSKWLSRSPHWYDDGGLLQPGLSLVANGTGKPEAVFTSSQWDTLRANVGGTSAPPNITVESHTYLDGREVSGIIDQRIRVYDADTGAALDAGRSI
jgi:hypothetical protein